MSNQLFGFKIRYSSKRTATRIIEASNYDNALETLMRDDDTGEHFEVVSDYEAREYAVSSGNGNDGVSHLYPDYIVTAPVDSEYLIARLACLASFNSGWGRKWAKRELMLSDMGPDSVQGAICDAPGRDGRGYSEHNGAWRLWDVYPADEASDASECPRYETLEACFGAALVRAHREKV